MLTSGLRIAGTLGHLGRGWFVLIEGVRQWLVPVQSVSYVEGVGRLATKTASGPAGSLRLGSALRGLARDRAEVAVHVAVTGEGGKVLEGVIDGVGQDFFDVAVTRGEVRRRGAVAMVASVPFASLVAVCSTSSRNY
ncbi:hypothetical protein AAHB33_13170 [Paenarthrobacter sp. S56]|uniref:hypothetical protein n=1 Tax=Paenarthrobacter sp. S56 TaxID=3138179 RepID=UPI0032192E9C